jgi:site-specific DNA-methyltransferase (adenine-specific)
MRKFGYLTPVVVDLHNKIADGEHRAIIYKELGLSEIPAIRMKLETDADRRELRQVLNKLHGSHDRSKDSDELVQILQANKLDELSEMLAQPAEDLKRLMSRYHPGFDDWQTPQEDQDELDALVEQELNKKEPHTILGDVFVLGEHRLICGDCTSKEEETMHKLLQDDKVAQLNCDPPYGVGYDTKNAWLNSFGHGHRKVIPLYGDKEDEHEFTSLFNTLFEIIPFADYNTIYIWTGGQNAYKIRIAMEQSKVMWGQDLIWIKNNLVLGRRNYHAKHEWCIFGWKGKHRFYGPNNRSTVLEYDLPQSNQLHPTMKPIPLVKQTITDGTQQDDIILDTFAGSGTSLIVSEQTKRKWRGIELSLWFCDVIIKRWEKYTGKEANKL